MIEQVSLQMLGPSERPSTAIILTRELLLICLALCVPSLASSSHGTRVVRSNGRHSVLHERYWDLRLKVGGP